MIPGGGGGGMGGNGQDLRMPEPTEDLAGRDLAGADLRTRDLWLDLAGVDFAGVDFSGVDFLGVPPDLKPAGDLAGGGSGSGGPPAVGQCVTDDDCGGNTCNPFFPGGRCLSCLSCPTDTSCNPNAGVCTQDCSDCGDTLTCGTVGGEPICNNPSCVDQSDCPSIYECRPLSSGSGNKACQRRLCASVGDSSCPVGTDCRKYDNTTFVCVETALF